MSHACKNFPYRIAQKYIILFYRDFDNFQKKVKFQRKIHSLLHVCKIYPHRTALDSQKCINSVFYWNFDTFKKCVKFQKNLFFVARMQKFITPYIPRFPKIHNSLLSGFWHFQKKVKFQKNYFLSHICKNLLHRTALDSQKWINSVFYRDFVSFQKKLKFQKKIIFVVRL